MIGANVPDVYASVNSLMAVEAPYVKIDWRTSEHSRLAVIAPHAGRIEPATGELAFAIAGSEHRFYRFAGKARSNNNRLHVTSTRFSEQILEKVLRDVEAIVAVHGCRRPNAPVTLIGGKNFALRRNVAKSLADCGFHVGRAKAPLEGRHPRNVTNRALAGGVQLEISRVQRDDLVLARSNESDGHHKGCVCAFCRYVGAIRLALDRYERASISEH